MNPPPARKLNRSPRSLRKQLDTAHRKNAELRERIEEQSRDIVSLKLKLRWFGIRILAKDAVDTGGLRSIDAPTHPNAALRATAS